MKIDIIKTCESDGNWYKVRIDGSTKACIRIDNKPEGEALAKATEIYDFYVNNEGEFQVVKEVEI
jgi:hypothetical protein